MGGGGGEREREGKRGKEREREGERAREREMQVITSLFTGPDESNVELIRGHYAVFTYRCGGSDLSLPLPLDTNPDMILLCPGHGPEDGAGGLRIRA